MQTNIVKIERYTSYAEGNQWRITGQAGTHYKPMPKRHDTGEYAQVFSLARLQPDTK